MDEAILFWTKVAALGQVAGAIATFLAVLLSLWIAFNRIRPNVKLSAGERLILGANSGKDQRVFMFKLANLDERPVQVLSLGWQTGWTSFGPAFLRKQFAVQVFNSVPGTPSPPFELAVGNEISAYIFMANLLDFGERRRADAPFFTRDFPVFGRRKTRIRVTAHLAGGRIIHSAVERSATKQLCAAEMIPLPAA